MQLTAKIKLLPTPEQRELLLLTLERANAACNAISEVAWEKRLFGRSGLHRAVYYETRQEFDLAAQVVIRCIGKVLDAYKKDKRRPRRFRAHGAIPYDNRILNIHYAMHEVSIWTLEGRQTMPFVGGQHQYELLRYQKGESKLAFLRGNFYLLVSCDVPTEDPVTPHDVLGVDVGIANLAVDSDGHFHSGSRYHRLRGKLQSKGTKSAKRLLKKRSGRERRFIQDVNHCISKQLVQTANHRFPARRGSAKPTVGRFAAPQRIGKGTQRAIGLEDLQGIRQRITVSRRQRYQMHSWAFYDLKLKISYKAQRAGVMVIEVDPRNTSRMCSACGYIHRSNRPTQDKFSCRSCGFAAHADYNAALNIRRRASVNAPYADSVLGTIPA